MKVSTSVFIVGILAIGVVFATPLENDLNDSKLQGAVDGLINVTVNQILESLPDPITLDKLESNFTSDLIFGSIGIDDFKLYGIKKSGMAKLDVNIFSFILNGTFIIPELTLNTKYLSDLTILELIPFYGNGRLSVTLEDIEIYISGKVGINEGLSISNATVSFIIGDGVFQVTGLLNDDFSVLLTTILNDIVVNFCNEYKDVISKFISSIAQTLINAILSSGTNSELLELQKIYEAQVAKLTK